MTGVTLDGAQRSLLRSLLDQLIPESADGRIPAAGALGVADFITDRIGADPALESLFQQGMVRLVALRGAHEGPVDAHFAEKLERQEPAFFAVLLRQTYMGYYSRGDIRARLGLSPKPAHPDGYDVPAQDIDEINALTAPVRRRGRCYRPV